MEKINKNIKKREIPNDVFITPNELVIKHLELVKKYVDNNDLILDPFFGTGNYYNSFKDIFHNNIFDYTEINLGLDFFEYNKNTNVIISNPPYSCIDKVLEKSVDLKPHTISYLIGINNLTCKRIEFMNNKGYFISDIHLTKVYKWFGMSCMIVFTNKVNKNIIEFDRIIYK
jgi:hypothetical protein